MLQIFGPITNPLKVVGPGYSGISGGGLTAFLGNIVRLLFVIGGIWAFLNFIIAGYGFLSAGDDPKKMSAAWAKIWQSLIGLVIIVSSFVIAAIAGQLIFGDAKAILSPTVFGPGEPGE